MRHDARLLTRQGMYLIFYNSVTEVGPHAADGSYARLRWNPLYPLDTGSRIRLEWARLDPATLLGRVVYETPLNYRSKRRTVDVILESFSPLGFVVRSTAHEETRLGKAPGRAS